MAKRSLRINWRRIATFVIGAYLVYWSAVSLDHMWVISRQQQALNHRIEAIKAQNHALQRDIHDLHNPHTLREILTGQAPLPSVDR
ncbi:hypothetical protein [Sulfobacillus harzensis]|uniref:Septum formation initiator n=1 Tax=Sulfobacillus harzensis TaxID=2729629 RepID=A0A7Y0Q2T7_9FIRM|nr:hypothetical protein [Sulfobacillus harzensis]NMP21499.1 hypothetical protein [Sulfobacillus harzensis]